MVQKQNSREVVVAVDNVSKKFCKNLKRSMAYGIFDLSKNLLGIKPNTTHLRKDEFWAIKNINFELRRGDSLGLIGRNGSGKTTILRLLAGLFPPDKGQIRIIGKVGTLIAVGAGFHPHMSGRENIYLNGAILGMSRKELDAKFDDILEFAEIDEFIDSPVATYSSGMRIRLGFSIATAIEPDVLLLDEILAVGDRQFRTKCFNRIGQLLEKCAVIFVSHNMAEIARVATSVMLCEQGEIIFHGDILEGIRRYNSHSHAERKSFVYATNGYSLQNIQLKSQKITWNDDLWFTVEFTSEKDMAACLIRVVILDETDRVFAEWRGENYEKKYDIKKGRNVVTECLPNLKLRDDNYYISFILSPPDGVSYLIGAHCCCSFQVSGGVYGNTCYQI